VSVGTGGTGVVLDGYGGLAPLGAGRAASTGAYWQGWDIARGVAGG
jgi:hypothetical protein